MLHPTCRRAARPRRGAVAVELALLLPVLAFLFVVAVDFARVSYYYLTITNCARSGAVYACDPFAATQSPYRTVQEAALADALDLTTPPTVEPPVFGSSADGTPFVEVTVTYPFRTFTSYPGVPDTLSLKRTVRMRVARTVPHLP
jgi:Flp pilus assembly protein TadG